jgi:hypothetical protein
LYAEARYRIAACGVANGNGEVLGLGAAARVVPVDAGGAPAGDPAPYAAVTGAGAVAATGASAGVVPDAVLVAAAEGAVRTGPLLPPQAARAAVRPATDTTTSKRFMGPPGHEMQYW